MRAQSFLKLLPFALLLAPLPAAASQTFPDYVKAKIPSLPCVPQCTLCHQANPGLPPANKPFALKLKAASPIAPQQVDHLGAALDKLQLAGVMSDADSDGKGDFDELALGEDPNDATVGATLCTTTPLYGCGATIAATPAKRSADPAAALAAVLIALAGVLVLRRRWR